MKKILLFCFCFNLLGCVSGPSLRGPEISPLGIATITASNDIGWLGEKKNSGGLIGDFLDKAKDD